MSFFTTHQVGEIKQNWSVNRMETAIQTEAISYPFIPQSEHIRMVKIGFWRRLPAFLIDNILLQFLTNIITSPLKKSLDIDDTTFASIEDIIQNFEALLTILLFSITIYFIISCFYFTYFYGSTGQSVGKKIMKIKVISATGDMITYRIAFIRYIGYIISEIPFFLGFLWIAFDKDKQGWHDKIAGTYVVKE